MTDLISLLGVMFLFFVGGAVIGWILNDTVNERRRRR